MFLCGSSVPCSFNVNLGSQIMQATCVITSRAWSYLAGTDERGGGRGTHPGATCDSAKERNVTGTP